MGFNSQAQNLSSGQGNRTFLFQEGVKYRHMSGKDAISFRILPAINPQNPDLATSWIQSLDPDGNLTDWGSIIKVVRFVGHGSDGQYRRDLLSLRTFDTPETKQDCPLETLYRVIQEDLGTWGYLTKGIGDQKDPNRIPKAFDRLSSLLVANILDINQAHEGVKLGVFSVSATQKLISKTDGLIFQVNAAPGIEEFIKLNYMNKYANGDITDPTSGPVLVCLKVQGKGDFGSYGIQVQTNQQTHQVMRRPMDQSLMAQRYDLRDIKNVVNVPTEETLVQSLVELLNGRSPQGFHEFSLLRLAFPQHRIPEPPAAPGLSRVVQGTGFGGSPGFSPQGGQMGGQVPQQAPAAQQWTQQPPPPPQQWTPPPPQQAPIPQQGGFPPGGFSPQAPAAGGAPAPSREVAGALANAAQAPQNHPVVPGDPVAGTWDKNEFLKKVRP